MWNSRPEERLQEWRRFRININKLPLEQAIKETVHLWSYAPYVTHYLVPDLPDEWPDPWTLVYENYYCDLAKALGMLYTLYLSSHYIEQDLKMELRIYKNTNDNDIVNTVWVNQGKYILNLIYDTVVNKNSIDQSFILKHKYTIQDLKLNLQQEE